jgi:hypothetical protein
MHLISVDDHLVEPPTLWSDRLPARFAEAGPRVVDEPIDGKPDEPPSNVWIYEGNRFPQIGLNAVQASIPRTTAPNRCATST